MGNSNAGYPKGTNRPKRPKRQQQLALTDGPETRAERIKRLLAGLGNPKITTADQLVRFDYQQATRIAEGTR